MEMRKIYKDAFLKKYGLKLGFMSVFVKAAAYALQSEPVVNAGDDIYTHVISISTSPYALSSLLSHTSKANDNYAVITLVCVV